MRYLLVTRGIPGSGKSYWIKKNGFEPYTISPDQIRLLFTSPLMDSSGKMGISQKMNKRVWDFVYQLLEERMDRGEFVVIDATHKQAGDFQKYQQLAKKYLYKIGCVDFSDVPFATCVDRNRSREEYKRVPDSVVEKHYQTIKVSQIPKGVTVINPDLFSDLNMFFKDANDSFIVTSKKVHVIGDIQGCFEPIREYFADGIKDDELYIFTGDFLDRGIQNGLVLRWAIDNLIGRDNVILIMGNHERHLVKWASDIPAADPENDKFTNNTLPQLLQERINKSEVYKFVSQMRDNVTLIIDRRPFFISHAGLGTIPKNTERMTSKQFWNGVGAYGEPIDKLFEEQSPHYIQIHGHRNTKKLDVKASGNSYNLEGKVEFGGHLRIVTITQKDEGGLEITPIEIKNEVYDKDLIPRTDLS